MNASLVTTDPTYNKHAKEILQSDEEAIKNFVVATRSEVHYTGKENIEGFAALVNMFMRSMHVSTAYPCIVNVDNLEESIESLKVDDGQLFYYSTLEFKDSFTNLLSKKIKSLATINVKTSFKSIAPDGGQISVSTANKLCGQTFNYLGLKSTIYVNK
jgi:hypothetical protein